MIIETNGNLLKDEAEALVNTVNCIGYMGKGIALQFKKAYPDNFHAYEKACKHKEVKTGRMFVFETGMMIGPKYIINFPTKQHWKGNSKIEYVTEGLKALIEEIKLRDIKSIAIPPLGCGNGGLDWSNVKPLILNALKEVPNVEVHLYEPAGNPAASDMPNRTSKPTLTYARAMLIKLMEQYKGLQYALTFLEIQKLAYFLQESGENLKLQYAAHTYGPYAPNLKKVIELLEGHYLSGYGDSEKPDTEITLLPNAEVEATSFLASHKESENLTKVKSLIEGFETPYGLELLASVHWVVSKQSAKNLAEVVSHIQTWTDRKKHIMKPEHIEVAYKHLLNQGWV